MQLVEPHFILLTAEKEIQQFPREIERYGRTCYQSEDKITDGSAERFCKMIIRRGHESVLEHKSIVIGGQYLLSVKVGDLMLKAKLERETWHDLANRVWIKCPLEWVKVFNSAGRLLREATLTNE